MSVFGPAKYRNCLREYWGILLRLHLWAALITVVLLAVSAWVLNKFWGARGVSSAFLGIMVGAPCILLFWAARRAMYVKLAPQAAAVSALLYCAVATVGIILIRFLGLISPLTAFIAMGAAAVVSSGLLLVHLKPSLKRGAGNLCLADVAKENWIYGRWALPGSILITVSGSIYYPLLGSFRGLAETGALKALLNLYSPLGQFFTALSLLLLPYAARRYHEEGAAGVERLIRKHTWLWSAGATAYWLVFLLFCRPILQFLYAGKYMSIAGLVPLAALASVLRIAATVQATALRAIQSPVSVFFAFCAAGGAGLMIGAPAIWALGIRGAVYTNILSSAIALGATTFLLRRTARRSPRVLGFKQPLRASFSD